MKQVGVIFVFVAATLLFNNEVKGQMVFDTLQLNELEILGFKEDYSQVFKKTSVDTLMKKELNNLDLGELLAAYTPVFVRSYGKGGLSTASFRGTGASHTQVLWDDFTINSPMLGQVDLSLVPNSFFDEVDLYYGGGSLLISSGALGGSVNLDNAPNFPEKINFNFEQAIGSFHTYSTAAGLSVGTQKFNSTTRFSFQSSKNDFTYNNIYILPQREMKQENADFRNVGFTQKFSYKPSRHHLISITTWNQWNNRNLPPIMTNVESGGKTREQQKDFFSRNIVSWSYHKNKSKLEVKAAFFFEEMAYILETEKSNGTGNDTLVDSRNKNSGVSARVKFGQSLPKGFSIATGIDFDAEQVTTNNYEGIKGRNTAAIYGNVVKDFLNRFKVNLLLRAEFVDERLLPLMPLFGLNFQILKKENLFARATISRNYHLPTLNDLFWNPGGNEDLDPEDGVEVEGGINYAKRFNKGITFGTDLSVFASRIQDWIQWAPSEFGYWSPQNINDVFARGIEYTLHLSGSAGMFRYKIFGGYSYTRTTNESDVANEKETSGRQLIYIPEHTANGFLYGSIKSYYVSWNLAFVGERSTTMGNTSADSDVLPAYFLNDISIGKSWRFNSTGLDLRLKIYNLFNVSYQAVRLRPMPGRNFEILIKFNLN